MQEGVLGRVFGQGDMDHHLAALGELDRIAQEIGEHLAQASGVSTHPGGKARIQDIGQLQPFTVGTFGQQFQHVLHHHAQIEVGVLEGQFVGFDFGKIQNIVDNRQQRLPRPADHLGVFPWLSRQLCV